MLHEGENFSDSFLDHILFLNPKILGFLFVRNIAYIGAVIRGGKCERLNFRES